MWQLEIKELSKDDAIELLCTAANDNQAQGKTRIKRSDLRNHDFFAANPTKVHNPQSIIHIADLIKEGKTFDAILQQYKEAQKKDLNQGITEFDGHCLSTNITYSTLQETYEQNELKLLFILVQCPSGLCLSDIKAICGLAGENFEKWKSFLQDISVEERVKEDDDSEGNSSLMEGDYKKIHKATFRVLISHYIEAIKDYHYLPHAKFTKYINQQVLDDKKRYQIFCLQYFASLSRKLMRSVKQGLMKSNIDLNLVCSIIDEGLVWGNSISLDTDPFERPDKRIELNQANFLSFLNLESLISQLIPND